MKRLIRALSIFVLTLFLACSNLDWDLHEAAVSGDTAKVKALLAQGANVNSKRSCMTPLMDATIANHPDTVRALLEAGADVDAQDCTGATAMSYAVRYKYYEVTRLLYFKGPPPFERTPTLTSTPFKGGNLDEQLFDRLGKIVMTDSGETEDPSNVQAIRDLIDQGANVNAKDSNGERPLVLAARNGHIQALQLLLDKGAEIDAQNYQGRTALMEAAGMGDYNMTRLLIKRGAKLNLKDHDGWTAYSQLGEQVGEEHQRVRRLLRQAGAR